MRGNHMVPQLFFTFCHPQTAGPMTCRGTIWSHSFFHLLSSRDSGSDEMRGNHMVPHFFSPFIIKRQSNLLTRRDKLWSSAPFFHYPETIKSVGTQRQIMVICTFFHYPETIKSDGTRRQIMVIRTLLLSIRLHT